jgi:hypothetical protein
MENTFDPKVISKPIMFRLIKRKSKPALRGRHYPMIKRIASEEEIYDPITKKTRTIRYAKGEPSIYKDEQPVSVALGDIIFSNGSLIVDGMNPNLMKFLEISNHNADNPYRLREKSVVFKKLDPEADAAVAMDLEVEQIEVGNIVLSMDIDELRPLARVLGISTDQSAKEIKHDTLMKAKRNPKEFMAMIDDPATNRQKTILEALDLGFIDITARNISWKVGSDKGMITPVPVGRKPVEYFAEWSMTDPRGEEVYQDLLARVEKAHE